jgi:hypothetical protein
MINYLLLFFLNKLLVLLFGLLLFIFDDFYKFLGDVSAVKIPVEPKKCFNFLLGNV